MIKGRGRENGKPNPFCVVQQPRRECMVRKPIKETLECMNNVVKNVQEELVKVNLNDGGKERMVKISKGLPEEEKRRLMALLKEYKDVFA